MDAGRISTAENDMGIGTILLVILVLALVGVLPTWPHSSGWGYGPSGGVGLILAVVVILFVLGKI
jgi:drug/metabolite transporter superfamily protein YnfA